jgi:hypothetical protein
MVNGQCGVDDPQAAQSARSPKPRGSFSTVCTLATSGWLERFVTLAVARDSGPYPGLHDGMRRQEMISFIRNSLLAEKLSRK